MRALLLNPPAQKPMIREGRCQAAQAMRQSPVPQLTLAYMATQLSAAGCETRLIDAIAEGLSTAGLLTRLREWRPRIIFANTTTPTIAGDLRVLSAVKEAAPEAFTAVFGAHATAVHADLARLACLDAVIRGEPEIASAAMVRALRAGRGLGGVAGVTHRSISGEIRVEAERQPVQDLDALGWPRRDLLPHQAYVHPVFQRRYTTLHLSRGCPHRCIFCVAPLYYGHPLRLRSVAGVLDEIEREIVGRYGIDHVWFYADDLTGDPEYLRRVCLGMLARGIKIRWWGNTRADARDPELFRLMARSGCSMLSVGGESGSDDILGQARKGLRAQDVAATVRMLRECGITSLVYFIIGLPGETLETIRRTVSFAQEADPDFAEFYPAVPYPGTELWDIAAAQALVADQDLAHYETGGTRSVLRLGRLEPRDLDREIRRAYRLFYARPRFLLNAWGRLKSLRDCANLARFGFNYVKRFLPNGEPAL